MKPKTEIQRTVIEYSKTVPKITKDQTQHALKSVHFKYVVLAYTKNHHCLECGHDWKADGKLTAKKNSSVCPSCKTKLKVLKRYENGFKDIGYYGVITTVKKMQVVRVFCSTKILKKGMEYRHSINEVAQHYVTEQGKLYSIFKPTSSWGMYYDLWIAGNLEFRGNLSKNSLKTNLFISSVYPKKRILPILKRNGFKSATHNIVPHILFQNLLTNNKIETLWKLKQYSLVQAIIHRSIDLNEYKVPIKIALRNNYIVKDVSDWKDYIDLLIYFNKDIHNAKYICPQNLQREHNRLVKKKAELTEAQEQAILKESIRLNNSAYLKEKAKFLSLAFKYKDIVIKPLQSVEEFYLEGKKLRHCIFTNEYFKKKDKLLFSAKKKGKRIETIEISLKDYQITQARGLQNKASKYNSDVKDLMIQNIDKIKEIHLQLAS